MMMWQWHMPATMHTLAHTSYVSMSQHGAFFLQQTHKGPLLKSHPVANKDMAL